MFQTILPLVLFLFPLAYSPGPGNMVFAANGARFGFRATLRANAGYHVATWIVTAAIGFGAMAALEAHPQVFQGLRFAGAGYVLWLAWKLLRAGVVGQGVEARPATFLDGVMLLVLNPKAYLIIALMFSQFLTPSAPDWVVTVLLITTIFTLNNLIAFSIWTVIGDRLARAFASPASAQSLNLMFGGVLAAVAIWMLLS